MNNVTMQHPNTVLRLGLGLAVGVVLTAAPSALADLLDFEELPSLIEEHPLGWIEPLGPNFAYQGFNFSAQNHFAYPPDMLHSWNYGNIPESLQDPPYAPYTPGLAWACESGEFALASVRSGMHTNTLFMISRLDGGLWTMDGAWFTRMRSMVFGGVHPNIRLFGYRGTEHVYTSHQPILHGSRKFVAPPAELPIDLLYIGMDETYESAGFFMDDLQYTLVPAPSAFALLGGAALIGGKRRSRQRDSICSKTEKGSRRA